jgi:hypothetical protein
VTGFVSDCEPQQDATEQCQEKILFGSNENLDSAVKERLAADTLEEDSILTGTDDLSENFLKDENEKEKRIEQVTNHEIKKVSSNSQENKEVDLNPDKKVMKEDHGNILNITSAHEDVMALEDDVEVVSFNVHDIDVADASAAGNDVEMADNVVPVELKTDVHISSEDLHVSENSKPPCSADYDDKKNERVKSATEEEADPVSEMRTTASLPQFEDSIVEKVVSDCSDKKGIEEENEGKVDKNAISNSKNENKFEAEKIVSEQNLNLQVSVSPAEFAEETDIVTRQETESEKKLLSPQETDITDDPILIASKEVKTGNSKDTEQEPSNEKEKENDCAEEERGADQIEEKLIVRQSEEQLATSGSTSITFNDGPGEGSVTDEVSLVFSKHETCTINASSSESSSILSTVGENYTKTSLSDCRATESSKSTTSSEYKIYTDVISSDTESKELQIFATSIDCYEAGTTDDQLSSGTFGTDDVSLQYANLPGKLITSRADLDLSNDEFDHQDRGSHMMEKDANTDYESIQQTTETRLSQENRSSSQASDISDKEIPASTPRSDITVSPGPLDSSLAAARFVWGENSENLVTGTVDIMTQSMYMPSTSEGDEVETKFDIIDSEDLNEITMRDPLLQMTETVLFIAASGKDAKKKSDQKEVETSEVSEENGNLLSETKGQKSSSDEKGAPSMSTNVVKTEPATEYSKLSDKSRDHNDDEKKDDDPVAGWGKPLGLPSPVRPSTPAKQPKKGDDEQMDTNKVRSLQATF